jgi:hypothetical protein
MEAIPSSEQNEITSTRESENNKTSKRLLQSMFTVQTHVQNLLLSAVRL